MDKITCELFCRSNMDELQILYTGFRLLELQGKIHLSYQISSKNSMSIPATSPVELLVKINNSILILFDMVDFGNIDVDKLESIDFLFKRSYEKSCVRDDLAFTKVFPLGLAYRVFEKKPSMFSLRRARLENSRIEEIKSIIATLVGGMNLVLNPDWYRFNQENCYALPNLGLTPKIIFKVKAWDPDTTKQKYRHEREMLNLMQAEIIRKMRTEFGTLFLGGITYSKYADKYFHDCIIEDSRLYGFRNYVNIMKEYPIGIATTRLHKSIGWKFAEYVAFSHAIVTEKLLHFIPGLNAGKHYLDFTTPDECVEQVSKLMEDKPLRDQMMIDNFAYYNDYLKPDKLVWNALSLALEHQA